MSAGLRIGSRAFFRNDPTLQIACQFQGNLINEVGSNLSPSGTISYVPTEPAYLGKMLVKDAGAGNKLSLAQALTVNGQDWSVMLIARPDTYISCKAGGYEYYFGVNTTNLNHHTHNSDNTDNDFGVSLPIADNLEQVTWLTGQQIGGNYYTRAYKNGVLAGSTGPTAKTFNAWENPFYMGALYVEGDTYQVNCREILFFRRLVTPSEVHSHYLWYLRQLRQRGNSLSGFPLSAAQFFFAQP